MSVQLGQIVLYKLSASDVDLIQQHRTSSESIRNRMTRNPPEWPVGAQAHLGDPVKMGDLVPLLVTRVDADFPDDVSGQAFLNGNDTYWVAKAEVVSVGLPAEGQAIEAAEYAGRSMVAGVGLKPTTRRA